MRLNCIGASKHGIEENMQHNHDTGKKNSPGVSFHCMLFGTAGLIDFTSWQRILKGIVADRGIMSVRFQARNLRRFEEQLGQVDPGLRDFRAESRKRDVVIASAPPNGQTAVRD